MLKLGIIGVNGVLGGALYNYFEKVFDVQGINRDNYNSFKGSHFDVLINANGNSKKFWAEQNVLKDFDASVKTVYESVFDFTYNKYIYISSADFYHKNSSYYGFHKFMAEEIIRKVCDNFVILRCSSILSKDLQKGVLYDALNNTQLYVSKESSIQFISALDISIFIHILVKEDIRNTSFNLGGKGTTSIKYIEELLSKKFKYVTNAPHQYYNMDVEKASELFPIKTSNEYVEEFIYERMEQPI